MQLTNYLPLIFGLTWLVFSAQAQTKTKAKKETAKPGTGRTITILKAMLRNILI